MSLETPPPTVRTVWNDRFVWINQNDEGQQPRLIAFDTAAIVIPPGERWFKFLVDSGWSYSVVVDAGQREACDPTVDGTRSDCIGFDISGRTALYQHRLYPFEARAYGLEGSLHGVPGNYSPARAALIFRNDTTDQFFYFRVRNMASVPMLASLRILKHRQKIFGHPLASLPPRSGTIAYFNLYRHRTRLFRGLTRNGHDGIDLAIDMDSGYLPHDVTQEVIAVADGEVLKSHLESCAIGHIVWIRHDTPIGTYTSMYAHLSSFTVTPGQRVRKGQRIGFLIEEPLCDYGYSGHLHFEMWRGIATTWHDGYSSGNGQIDPLPILFEK